MRWIVTSALLLQAMAASALPFIRDDFARARTGARQRSLPIFVEVWAPW